MGLEKKYFLDKAELLNQDKEKIKEKIAEYQNAIQQLQANYHAIEGAIMLNQQSIDEFKDSKQEPIKERISKMRKAK